MLSVTVDDLKKIEQIKESLFNCSTKDGVDRVFSQFGINNFSVKTTFLRQSMQVQEISDVPNDQVLSDEDAYEDELAIFLDGTWRGLI